MTRGRDRKKGRIIVLSSPSGGGKTTLCNALKKERFDIIFSVSATTRRPRSAEKNGRDYIFLRKEEFERLLAKNEFLEWADNFGDFYGTPKRFVLDNLAKGKDVMLAIDVKGAMRVKKMFKDVVLVFVLPPSLDHLEKRLKARKTETKEAAAKRLLIAKKELACAGNYDYAIVNDDLAETVEALKSIIIAERNRINR